MNASRHQLPHRVSEDRRRAREAALEAERQRLVLVADDLGQDTEADDFRRLPNTFKTLPKDLDFPLSHISALGAERVWTLGVEAKARVMSRVRPLTAESGYRQLYKDLKGDFNRVVAWRDDAEFARQRLTGVNPMPLKRVRDVEPGALFDTAARVYVQLREEPSPATRRSVWRRSGRWLRTATPGIRWWHNPASPFQRHCRRPAIVAW